MNPGIAQQGTLPVAMPYGLLGRPQPIPTPNQWSGGFNPTLVGTLTAWYDFSDLSTLTLVNGLISSITNKSGVGPTLNQSVEANRPALGQLNGRVAASFDGNNDVLFSQTNTQARGSLFVVCGPAVAIDRCVSHFCNSIGGTEALVIGTNNTRAILGAAGRWSGTGGVNIGVTVEHGAHGSHIVSATFDRFTTPRCRVNGATQASSAGGVSNGNHANASIGARNVNGNYVGYWSSAVGEVLLYTAVLAGDQIFAVEQYLSKKWGAPA